ncbi:MAG: MFS transporter, partial [Bacteroidota bacterium]
GWRSIFFIAFFFGVLTTTASFLFLGKDTPSSFSFKKIALKGTFFYMTGLMAMIYGSSQIPDLKGSILILAGIIALFFFWKLESKSSFPVIDTSLYMQNRLFSFSNMAALINYSATFAIVFFLSLYLQNVRGFSPRDAGIILVAQPAMMAIFSPLSGKLSDKIQPRILTTIGMLMCSAGLLGFAFLSDHTSLVIIVMLLLWVGMGFALFSSPNMNTIMSSVAKTQYGLASGSAATMRVVGQIVSMTIATLFFAAILGDQSVELVSDTLFLQAMQWGFISFFFISLPGIYFSYHRGDILRSKIE